MKTILTRDVIPHLSLAAFLTTSAMAFGTPEIGPTGNDDTAAFIKMDVESDSRMNNTQVSVKLENGIIRLTGEVATIDQAERAAERALATVNVRAVVNELKITPAEVPDGKVSEAVNAALRKNKAIDASRVKVAAATGRVTLSGEVGTWDEQEIAREIASTVPGVTAIDNKTEVVFDSVRTDDQIRAQLQQLIANDPLYDGLALSVSVKEGIVKLKGDVGSKSEYDRLVRRTSVTGVFEVNADGLNLNSDLQMEAMGDKHFSQEQMLAALGDALKVDSRLDAASVKYEIAEGVVTLNGQVGSPLAKSAAESTARGVPGVIAVNNQLRIHEEPRALANMPVVTRP